jgi:cytochrome c
MSSPRRALLLAGLVFGLAFVAQACAPADPDTPASAAASSVPAAARTAPTGLTPFEIEHGIGPVTAPIALAAAVDTGMSDKGKALFDQKCAACHKMTERYVGPSLGDVTRRRSPAFLMNMVLNPQGMVEKHPVTKKLLGEFYVPMPNQGLTEAEARQVVEYLRTQAH